MSVTGKVVGLTALILVFAGAIMFGGIFWNSEDKPEVKQTDLQSSTSSNLTVENGTSTPGNFFVESQETGF